MPQNALRQRQPDAAPFHRTHVLAAVKRFRDLQEIFRRDADPRILNIHCQMSGFLINPDDHRTVTVVRVLQCIFNDVVQGKVEQRFVAVVLEQGEIGHFKLYGNNDRVPVPVVLELFMNLPDYFVNAEQLSGLFDF